MSNSTTISTTSEPSTSDGIESSLSAILPNIAFVGKAGAGKSTAAQYLEHHFGYVRRSFADLLKHVATEIWGSEALTDRGKLQGLGVAVRNIDPNAWVNACVRDIDPEQPVVIDDCRFPNEVGALQKRGFVFVRIHADVDERVLRLQRNGKFQNREQLEHISETAIDNLVGDYQITNTGDLSVFEYEVFHVLQKAASRT